MQLFFTDMTEVRDKKTRLAKTESLQISLIMIGSGRRSEESVISLGLLNCDEVRFLQASRLCSLRAVIDQRLQFKNLKPLLTLLR